MKIIYDLAKNGLAKLNLPLELNFPVMFIIKLIFMYHVHENVVVVGIDLSGFSMYYLFKKNQICCYAVRKNRKKSKKQEFDHDFL